MSTTPTPPPENPPVRPAGTEAGARPVEDDRDRNGGAWIWALVALLILGLLAFFLLRGGDDGDTTELSQGEVAEEGATDDPAAEDGEPGTDDTAPEDGTQGAEDADEGAAGESAEGATDDAPAEDGAGDDDAATDDGSAAGAAGATGEDDPGVIRTEDDENLFDLLQGDEGDAERLAPYVDTDVEGEGVVIQQVVDETHFWVGTSEEDRIFVHLGADMTAEGVEIAEGERISFSGFLKANPPEDSADVHDLPEDQGGEQHRQQGHHIELTEIASA